MLSNLVLYFRNYLVKMHNLSLKTCVLRRISNHRPIWKMNTLITKHDIFRFASNMIPSVEESPKWLDASDRNAFSDLIDSFIVYNDFITEDEERSLMNELNPYMRRLRYERDHWDDVSAHGFVAFIRLLYGYIL